MADNEDDIEPEVRDSPHFARLRQQHKDALTENEALKARLAEATGSLLTNAVKLGGHDPENGVTKLLLKEYGAKLGDDLPTAEGFAELAAEFGIQPVLPAAGTPPEQTIADQLQQLQNPGDQLRAMGQVPEPADIDDQIAAAEASGNAQLSIALKVQKQRDAA